MRKRLITENPFGEMKGVSIRSNRSRDHFIPREDAAKVLEHCPDTQWKLLFALSRYGGLRCPSEHLALKWVDVDWANGRMTVRSPKTEHHEGRDARVIPIFSELRPYLEDAWELAKDAVMAMTPEDRAKAPVITRYRDAGSNLRSQLERIIGRAGLKPWPKLFQNLRATRATELAAVYPAHVAADWLGHSTMVAQKHYWRTTDADFDKATTELPEAVQSASVSDSIEVSAVPTIAALCGKSVDLVGNQATLADSNSILPRPSSFGVEACHFQSGIDGRGTRRENDGVIIACWRNALPRTQIVIPTASQRD